MIPVAAPALPLDEAGKYVAGAYVVFLALLLIYVAIMSVRLGRGSTASWASSPTSPRIATRGVAVAAKPR